MRTLVSCFALVLTSALVTAPVQGAPAGAGSMIAAAQEAPPQTPPPAPPAEPTQTPAQPEPQAPAPAPPVPANVAPQSTTGITPPAGYVVGPDDVLAILFWREKDLSVEVAVRPDGMITLPLINDLKAAGLTPDDLRTAITQAASRYVEDPNVTVVVKQINSRKVFVTGQIAKPGTYGLSGPTTVLQMIATAGGLADFAKSDRIVIMRTTDGKTETIKFNYKDVMKGKNLQQNIELRPGDTILVP